MFQVVPGGIGVATPEVSKFVESDVMERSNGRSRFFFNFTFFFLS